MSENLLTLTIDGHEVKASADSSIIQAYARSGNAITANVGCMGQGVCGSCRCMIRKEGEREVTTALACETKVEEGMQVSFLDYFIPEHIQYYDVSEIGDGWNWLDDTAKAFPEAQNCRHCGGCNRACPKGLQVENGVAQVVSGDFGGGWATLPANGGAGGAPRGAFIPPPDTPMLPSSSCTMAPVRRICAPMECCVQPSAYMMVAARPGFLPRRRSRLAKSRSARRKSTRRKAGQLTSQK